PGQAAFVEAILPDGDRELHGLDRGLAVDDDRALLIDLGAAETPRHRVRPVVGITEAVAEGLAHRAVLLLQLDADLAPLVPRVRKLGGADFLEPVLAIRPRRGDRAERHRLPVIADDADLLVVLVVR